MNARRKLAGQYHEQTGAGLLGGVKIENPFL